MAPVNPGYGFAGVIFCSAAISSDLVPPPCSTARAKTLNASYAVAASSAGAEWYTLSNFAANTFPAALAFAGFHSPVI